MEGREKLRKETRKGGKGAVANCFSSTPAFFWTPTHIITPPTSLPQPIYKPLCVFRNSVGLLCISESLSAGWGEEEEEEWRDEGLREAKKEAQMDSAVKQLPS